MWGSRCNYPLISVHKSYKNTLWRQGFITTAPVDRWVICLKSWINVEVGAQVPTHPSLLALVFQLFSTVLQLKREPRDRRGDSLPVRTLSYWLEQFSCWRWTTHWWAGGSGEKFGSTAPPISFALIPQPLSGYTTPILVGQSLLKRSLSSSLCYSPCFLLFTSIPWSCYCSQLGQTCSAR